MGAYWKTILFAFCISILFVSEGLAGHSLETPYVSTWSRAEMFRALEKEFHAARDFSPSDAAYKLQLFTVEGLGILTEIEKDGGNFSINNLYKLEDVQFRMAALAAAYKELIPAVVKFTGKARVEVMRQAHSWPLERGDLREALYRVIYGGRTAIEEAIIQGDAEVPPLLRLDDIPSRTPRVLVKGVRFHSGDILVSGAGDVMSILTDRSSNFPGGFSHVAILHVDPDSGEATVIEAIPEKGVIETPLDLFLTGHRNRVLLLRLRPDYLALQRSPMVPHSAAAFMLSKVRGKSIPYDFAMDTGEIDRYFGAELVYRAYQGAGVDLWTARSGISSPGAASWLRLLGIRDINIILPSDLQFNPGLAPVAEWRSTGSLRDRRYESAVFDALLNGAEKGDRLGYPLYKLPGAVLLKVWSMVQKIRGGKPDIPEGIGAVTALRLTSLSEVILPRLKEDVKNTATNHRRAKGYEPTYRELYEMALNALSYRREQLSPALKSPTAK